MRSYARSESRFAGGSSAIKIPGFTTSALASSTLAASPADISSGKARARWRTPMVLRVWAIRFLQSFLGCWVARIASSTFSYTFRSGSRPYSACMSPICLRKKGTCQSAREVTSVPLTQICPLVGRSCLLSIFKSVLFPAPLFPITKTNSPVSTEKETFSSAYSPSPYRFSTFLKTISFSIPQSLKRGVAGKYGCLAAALCNPLFHRYS